jgi:hypothetical protein
MVPLRLMAVQMNQPRGEINHNRRESLLLKKIIQNSRLPYSLGYTDSSRCAAFLWNVLLPSLTSLACQQRSLGGGVRDTVIYPKKSILLTPVIA